MTASLTVYFGERERTGGRLVADALLDVFAEQQVAASILLRGAEGYGMRHHLRTDTTLTLSEDLPFVALAVDSTERIAALEPAVTALAGRGLVTMEDDGGREPDAASTGGARLRVLLGRKDRLDGEPAFVAVCDLLRRAGVSGATALLGVDGTARGQRERARFFGRNAQVPLLISAVGEHADLSRVWPTLRELLPAAQLSLTAVRVCKRDGQLVGRPEESGQWQRFAVYSSEVAQHDGVPMHRSITRRLRAAGAAGSTTVRGVWGFHGDHAPHGDRLAQLGRRVPTVTTVIEAPQRCAATFAILDELTAERGLVTVEDVAPPRPASAGPR